ncbi:MAG: TonB-dependent receptor plug domain-containing protein [Bacteroidales bacterium]|nr:TonB-dependent receptor plug domain-containing protein [Bacteroidales bacterium]
MKNCIFKLSAIAAALLCIASCSSQRVAASGKEDRGVYGNASLTPGENERNSYTNIYSYLRGKVPGVTVNGTEVHVRGVGSVNSGTAPLFIVDGVELQDISTINPQEIERVDVLKDASASIYGFRGANGVIKITTINGRTKQK